MNRTEILQEDPALARKMLLWLVFECPLGGNPNECQLRHIRLRTFEDRRRWVSALSDEECLGYLEAHRECLRVKEHRMHQNGVGGAP